jgi:hypothetical protein
MKRLTLAALFLVLAGPALMADTQDTKTLLRVTYVAQPGSDIEHGQGAIERNELEHCVLGPTEWLIRVPSPASETEWRAKLDAAVTAFGCFEVQQPSASERERAERGALRFQQ